MSAWVRGLNSEPDFEVEVRFLSPEEGGRKTAAHQGYRPDMIFAVEPHTWMIWPEFLREDGSPYEPDEPVPLNATARANMYVCYPEVRSLIRPLVHVGQKVQMVEGAHPVAAGEVTALKNLPNNLSSDAEAAIAFYRPAKAYMRWLDNAAGGDNGSINMRELHAALSRLQEVAAGLPAIAPANEEYERQRERAETTLERQKNLESKLPLNLYGVIFDPLDESDRQRVDCSLWNDLGEIHADLYDGAALYNRGEYRDALWRWHFSYYAHWGRHLAHAQCAVWQYLSEGNWS